MSTKSCESAVLFIVKNGIFYVEDSRYRVAEHTLSADAGGFVDQVMCLFDQVVQDMGFYHHPVQLVVELRYKSESFCLALGNPQRLPRGVTHIQATRDLLREKTAEFAECLPRASFSQVRSA